MILTVYLSDGEQAVTEVPITPETTCRDVVEFCKEPGESGCHLAEVWRGNERAIPFEHMMYEHLQKWGPRKQEVKFFLRHEDSPTESSDQGSQQSQDQTSRRSGNTGEKHNENGRIISVSLLDDITGPKRIIALAFAWTAAQTLRAFSPASRADHPLTETLLRKEQRCLK
ncbi:apoptosis-stimulating of p53 protein 1-like, partial [Plectropomus leopardus]|uniref:apoptosis-stimulating of p53 protein 1-like n=1 Tax=Plectropomus leopardus TaxID=160734 RepID=UPI001C4B6B89